MLDYRFPANAVNWRRDRWSLAIAGKTEAGAQATGGTVHACVGHATRNGLPFNHPPVGLD